MTQLVNQKTPATARKVQWASWASSVAAPLSALFSYPFAVLIVDAVPFWQSDEGFAAVLVLIELAITGFFTGATTWAVGWWTRARAEDVGQ